MPRVKQSKSKSSRGRPVLKCIDRKPIRPLERQRMRPWLIELLDRKNCHQLDWHDKHDMTFKVSWKHAAGQTFDPNSDATLFELWARHTGKYYSGDRPDPKKWKANFRCALHSLPDVEEDKKQSVRRGFNAYRVYRFLNEKRIKNKGKNKDERCSDEESEDEELRAVRNLGTKSRPKKMDTDSFDSEGSEAYSPSHDSNHSDWDMNSHDNDSENEKSPLPNFEELYKSCPPKFSYKSEPRVPETNTVQEYQITDTIIINDDGDYTDESSSQEHYTLQFMCDEENSNGEFYAYWPAAIDSNLDVQEEVVTTDGPNVETILNESSSYEYTHEYTSMSAEL